MALVVATLLLADDWDEPGAEQRPADQAGRGSRMLELILLKVTSRLHLPRGGGRASCRQGLTGTCSSPRR